MSTPAIHMKTIQEEKSAMVELVKGPICGLLVKWPYPDRQADIKSPCGMVRYELEKESMKGNQTAICIRE